MSPLNETRMVQPGAAHEAPTLDLDAIETVRSAAVVPAANAANAADAVWRKGLIKLLNDTLATELVCVLRYKRHYYATKGIRAKVAAAEFLEHAQDEQGHADEIAQRIVQLGENPDLNPSTLAARSHAEYDESDDLAGMLKANLIAERIAIESYREMIAYVGERDPTTHRMLKGILAKEEEHAEDLADLLDDGKNT
jgi:bacterioferritin